MLFTARCFVWGIALLALSACASMGDRCGSTSPPNWLNKTAFELKLPSAYYYGKGQGKTRAAALADAQGEIALQVSANIFSRSVVQQTNERVRAEAVSKAISDVQGSGVEPMFEWQAADCSVYALSRVSKKVAASWKTAAQSYLVQRPGLGFVRRAAEETNAISYAELNSPPLLIQWQNSQGGASTGKQALIESQVRKTLRQSGINIVGVSARAKVFMSLTLEGEVLAATLSNRQGRVLAKSAHSLAESVKRGGTKLTKEILDEWLGDRTRQNYR